MELSVGRHSLRLAAVQGKNLPIDKVVTCI